MEKIQKNICKQACSYVFVQENYIKAHVLMYFLHLVLTFTPHYIIMVKAATSLPSNCARAEYSVWCLVKQAIVLHTPCSENYIRQVSGYIKPHDLAMGS